MLRFNEKNCCPATKNDIKNVLFFYSKNIPSYDTSNFMHFQHSKHTGAFLVPENT